MQHALHHNLFHLIIVILVSVDALIVIFELLIDVGAFSKIVIWLMCNISTGAMCAINRPYIPFIHEKKNQTSLVFTNFILFSYNVF